MSSTHDPRPGASDALHIDCDDCTMRDIACGDCVVSVLLGQPPSEWEDEEQRALEVLADQGLVPPLRLVRGATAAPSTAVHRVRRYRPRPPAAAG